MSLAAQYAPEVGIAAACCEAGISRSTWYRRRKKHMNPPEAPEAHTKPKAARRSARRLSDDERAQVLSILCCEEFMNRSPRAIHATLLDRGKYLCSERTMYRILNENHASRERRAQRTHPHHATPICCAKAVHEVWTWDITKIAGPGRAWFNLYVILDLYSRYVVGWLLSRRESATLAKRLIEQSLHQHEVDPTCLTIHADRGAPMRSKTVAQLMADLCIERSHSRPRVSNDNPYSESHFKTLKYSPEYPRSFQDYESAKQWCHQYLHWYNHEHRHGGIAHFTPHDVLTGRHLELARVRQTTLDKAYAMHPNRFVRGRPKVASVPNEVWINKPSEHVLTLAGDPCEALALPGGRGDPRGEGPRLPLVAATTTDEHANTVKRREMEPERIETVAIL